MFGKKCFSCDWSIVEVVYFLYKTGEAMLDASILPFIADLVCRDVTYILGQESFSNSSTQDVLSVSGDMYFNDSNSSAKDFLMTNETICLDSDISIANKSSMMLMMYRILVNVPATLIGLMWGSWSDKYGRKLPMALPSVGSAVAIMFYMAAVFEPSHKLGYFSCGALVQGIMGKSSLITMAVNSYIVDTTIPEDRTAKLGKLLAMNFSGLCFGSVLSSIVQDTYNLQVSLMVVVVFHAITVFIVTCFVNETVHSVVKCLQEKEVDKQTKLCNLLTLEDIKESCHVLVRSRSDGGRIVIVGGILTIILHQMCKVGEQDVTVLFIQKPPLSWTPSGYGYLQSVQSASLALCMLGILPVMSRGINLNDVTIVIMGLFCKLVRALWAGFCTETWMVYTSVIISGLGAVIGSAIRSLLSKTVEDDETGKVFALASSGETVAKLVGSVLFINLYAATLDLWAGVAYVSAGAVYFILLLIMTAYMCRHGGLASKQGSDVTHEDTTTPVTKGPACTQDNLQTEKSTLL